MRLRLLAATVAAGASYAHAALLVDYNAARGDPVKNMGRNLNLQKTDPQVYEDGNLPDLYIKAGKDWAGVPAALVHRKKGYRRAEYHALNNEIQNDTTYFIGYSTAVNQLTEELVIFQWKEYGNTEKAKGGANIPFELRFNSEGRLALRTGQPDSQSPITLWTTELGTRKLANFGMEIVPKYSGGTMKLWYNGKRVTFTVNGEKTTTFTGCTQPQSTSPKWGAYRGEATEIDTWIYQVQVGTKRADLDQRFFSTEPSQPTKPEPLMPGIVSNCQKFHLVKDTDTCQSLVDKYKTFSLKDFYTWNPEVGNNCAELWTDYYVCVGV